MQFVSSWHDARFSLDYRRYQQYAAPLGTFVDDAQLTVVSRAGEQLIVGGAYYPAARSIRPPALSVANALAVAADERGGLNELPQSVRGLATRRAHLRLDPESGSLFYLVATGAPGANRYQQIDAHTGELLDAWSGVDQVSPGQGVGVKGDTKTLTPGTFASVGDLTNGSNQLQSPDGKFVTYNANFSASPNYPTTPMSDTDNTWTGSAQAAAVDAQYYAALTVEFYRQQFGWDWFDSCSDLYGNAVRSVVHYGRDYDNAFWDDIRFHMVYGDGSSTDRALSAGQDVVAHELTHGVTQCRADLRYRNQSGALNEAISDIMATASEWTLEEQPSSNCRLAPGQTECADWLLGEDLARTASGAVIRNLADPEAEGQPSHFEDRVFIGTNVDSGGVHYNSGIINHAYYLLVKGGRNARCSGPTDPHADCDVVVPPTSPDHAQQVFFSAFGMLTYDATMCDARNLIVAAAQTLYPGSVTDLAAVLLAWQAVGLGEALCDSHNDYAISLADPTIELAPGASGQLQLDLVRHLEAGEINFSVDKVAPATVGSPNPSSNSSGDGSSQIPVDADSNAADGTYPILVTATGSGEPHYAAAALVIDAGGPTVGVNNVRFVPMTTVTTSGVIPVRVTWSAYDAGSGVASAELDHSPNGTGWLAIPGASSSPTQYDTTAGPHQFQVIATDALGNSATSPALVCSLGEFQESAVTLKYAGSWSTFNSATAWGKTIFSKRRGAAATFTFNGTDVAWIAQRGPKRGVANVFVDGVKTHVDLYSSTLTERRVVFVAAGLAAGPHTIKIVVRATSGRPRVDVDGFFVLSQ